MPLLRNLYGSRRLRTESDIGPIYPHNQHGAAGEVADDLDLSPGIQSQRAKMAKSVTLGHADHGGLLSPFKFCQMHGRSFRIRAFDHFFGLRKGVFSILLQYQTTSVADWMQRINR